MSTATLTQDEVKATHADRPHAREQLPFRLYLNGRFRFHQWDELTTNPFGQRVNQPFQYPIDDSPGNFGLHVARLQERCALAESEVDGLLAKIDGLTTSKVEADGELKSLRAQVAELKRQLETSKSAKNGRKE